MTNIAIIFYRFCIGTVIVLVASTASLAALSFDIRYVDDENGTFATQGWLDANSLFQRNIAAAANLWGQRFASNARIIVKVDPMSFAVRAGGTHSLGRRLHTNSEGNDVWEAGPLTRILTGNNPGATHSGYDILLGFDAAFVESHYWFDPEPQGRSTPVPANKGDFVSVVMHELGHGFGITGFRDFETGEIFGSIATQMDDLSYFGGNGNPFSPSGDRNPMYFRGERAAEIFGSHVPLPHKPVGHLLYGQNFFHLSACSSGAPDGLEGTLMNGCSLPNGERLPITPIDTAVLADMGYPLTTLNGDLNNDGSVDAADYVAWRNMGPPNQSQYVVWRSNFGARVPSGASVARSVPELPAGRLILIGVAQVTVMSIFRWR